MIGYNHPPQGFPARAITNHTPPREMIIRGRSAIDPDVWVAHFIGDERVAWVVRGSGGICHDDCNVMKDAVVAWLPVDPEYDDGDI